MAETSENLVAGIESPDNAQLRRFFRNHQRFLHLYALARGRGVTADSIKSMLASVDPGSSFSQQAYDDLRDELKENDWIVSGSPDTGEHWVDAKKLDEFVQEVIDLSRVERPAMVDKYHVFDIGLNYTNANAVRARVGKLRDEVHALKNSEAETPTFYPGFLLQQLLGTVSTLAAERPREHVPGARESWLQRLRSAVGVGWPLPALASVAILALATGLLGYDRLQNEQSRLEERSVVVNAPVGPFIEVSFKPGATEVQVRSALRDVNARIVSGPTEVGDYYVYVRPDGANTRSALQKLGASEYVQALKEVERVPPER